MGRLRRTMMFVPGNNPGMLKDAHIFGADSVMFDLEDSVSVNQKDAARFMVFNAISSVDYGKVEVVSRINGLDTPYGKEDIAMLVKAGVDVIRLPKTVTAQDLTDVENEVFENEKKYGLNEGTIKLMAAIEDPLGAINAYDIAKASDRLIGIALGAEDYVRSMKTRRYADGQELFFARTQIVNAARAAGIYALDTVYSDVNNEDGLRKETELIKQLGFDGKSVINPRQIGVVHSIFNPTEAEIENARRIIMAIEEAEKAGSGVVALDGKMIDVPVVKRAERVIEIAKASGLL